MNRKQFVNLVERMQNAAYESHVRIVSNSTRKYEYKCIRSSHAYIDWEIWRRIRGTVRYSLYALHESDRKIWVVHEGENYHLYTDTELERWRTK